MGEQRRQAKAQEARNGRRKLAVEHDREVAERKAREDSLKEKRALLVAHEKALRTIDAAINQHERGSGASSSSASYAPAAVAAPMFDDDLDDLDMLLGEADVEVKSSSAQPAAMTARDQRLAFLQGNDGDASTEMEL